MSDIGFVGGMGTINVSDLKGMDLEALMMTVQSRRANILESRLQDQINAVQGRNDQIGQINDTMNAINQLIANFQSGSTDGTTIAAGVSPNAGGAAGGQFTADRMAMINDALAKFGLQPLGPAGVNGDTTKAQLDSALGSLKGQLDSLNGSQQMDMLKLQTLTNQRNEAFDLMSNFVKKMADSRSSILGNMR